MPDFRVVLSATPPLANVAWIDPPSDVRPSRVVQIDDRVNRKIVAQPGTVLLVSALLLLDSATQYDTQVGHFNMWAIEYPGDGPPMQNIPDPDMSAEQEFVLDDIGHYTIVVRHENTGDAPQAAAGGAVIVHVDVEVV